MTHTLTRPRLVPSGGLPVISKLWYRPQSQDLLLATLSSLLCALVVAGGINRYPWVGGDEGIYTSQAWAMLHGSITPYTYTYDHPFFGWAQLASLSWFFQWLHIGGSLSVVNVRAIMVVYAFAQLMLVYGIARRLQVRKSLSVVAVFLLGLSPLWVVDSRQVFLDNVALPWVLGAFFIALNPKKKQWNYGAAGACMAIGVLSKETVVLLLPALAYLVWVKAYKPIRMMSIAAFGTFTVLTIGIYPLFALLRNEFFPGPHHVSLWTNGIMYQLATRKGSGALWELNSVRHGLFIGWTQVDPWLIYSGAVAAILVVFVKRIRVVGLCFLLWSLPMIKPGGYLPAMYVIAVLPFAALSVACLADAMWNGLLRVRVRSWLAVTAMLALLVGSFGSVGRSYLHNDRHFTTSTFASESVLPGQQAVAYIKAHARTRDNILTDDGFWLDLVRSGFSGGFHGAISYYQFDLDPESSTQNLPEGWKDINYVLETPSMQGDLAYLGLTKTAATLQHSTVVAVFGKGSSQIIVRKVVSTPYNL